MFPISLIAHTVSIRHNCHRTVSVALAFLVTLTFLPIVSAQVATKDVKVSGMGIRKCSEWHQWKDSQNGEARAMTLEWANGFIAGHNVYARSGTEVANSVVADVKVLIPLLDSYCQKNPESRIISAVVEITKSLGGTKINVAPKGAMPPLNPQPRIKGERDT